MQFTGRFYDGENADVREGVATLQGSPDGGTWIIANRVTGYQLAVWPAQSVRSAPARSDQLWLTSADAPAGVRFVLDRPPTDASRRELLPSLAKQARRERRNQFGLMAAATGLLAAVLAGYLYGIPLVAGPVTDLMPPEWEASLGQTVADQLETTLSENALGFTQCDTDPSSVANRAIARFIDQTTAEVQSPFDIRLDVVATDVPNAFALPGGQLFYFSALLDQTETSDEFAGVVAHEIGHAVHRHAMRNLVASAGTGVLIGFVLGDLTGVSIAGGLGAAAIDSRHSRDAERAADAFAADAASRIGFDPTALADLLERVADDDEFAAALALLSSHPLTQERRLNLQQLIGEPIRSGGAFTEEEWYAIQTMCDGMRPVSDGRSINK